MREWIAATMLLMAAGCSAPTPEVAAGAEAATEPADPPLKAGERVILIPFEGQDHVNVWVVKGDGEIPEAADPGSDAVVIQDEVPGVPTVRVSTRQGPYVGPCRVARNLIRRVR